MLYRDSLILLIYTEDVYEDVRENISWFDTSNYKVDNVFRIPKTVFIIGKMNSK